MFFLLSISIAKFPPSPPPRQYNLVFCHNMIRVKENSIENLVSINYGMSKNYGSSQWFLQRSLGLHILGKVIQKYCSNAITIMDLLSKLLLINYTVTILNNYEWVVHVNFGHQDVKQSHKSEERRTWSGSTR